MSFLRACVCPVEIRDSSVYFLAGVWVCVNIECTQEYVSGMWALQSFACKLLIYLSTCTLKSVFNSGNSLVSVGTWRSLRAPPRRSLFVPGVTSEHRNSTKIHECMCEGGRGMLTACTCVSPWLMCTRVFSRQCGG